jgi:hypothetical protein
MRGYDVKDGGQDAFLFANRRGGSTWLAEVIATAGRFRVVDQPLCLHTAPVQLIGKMPLGFGGHPPFFEGEGRVVDYLRSVQSGELRVNEYWRFWNRRYWQNNSRTLYKMTLGMPLLPQLSNNLDGVKICFLRNPLSQAWSVFRAGWGPSVGVFLQDRLFVDRFLDPPRLKIAEDISRRGDEIECLVLEWILDKLPIFEAYDQLKQQCVFLSYEELYIDSERVFGRLSECLGLEMTIGYEQLRKPSRTAAITTKGGVREFGDPALLHKWQNAMPVSKIERLYDLVDEFGINFYNRDDHSPTFSIFDGA